MKIVYTKHALEKLDSANAKSLEISRKKIDFILKNPKSTNFKINPHRKTGDLSKELSLCVIYKIEDGIIKVITFYPAKKGRYESKV